MPFPVPLSVTQMFGRTVVTFPAEIDVCNAPTIRRRLIRLLDDGAGPLILDLTPTSFCDCSGVGAIVSVENRAAALRRQVCLVLPPAGSVRRIATMMGLFPRFLVTTSLTAAHAALRQETLVYVPASLLAGLDA